MLPQLSNLLGLLTQGDDGIYSDSICVNRPDQQVERALRERVAAHQYDDYLATIAKSHSIPVMEYEVRRFLDVLPRGAIVLDVGGCWGWHWRGLGERPDIGVVIVDFVRTNLAHAKSVLGQLIGQQVALVHGDATALPFRGDGGFDGVWTVQVFQHIPDFARACRESYRVLNSGGRFQNTSLHITPANQVIHRIVGRKFHTAGMIANTFHLTRASDEQRAVVAAIFQSVIADRYTECLFHPDLRLSFSGRAGVLWGASTPNSAIGRRSVVGSRGNGLSPR